jgi:hypothetical protein
VCFCKTARTVSSTGQPLLTEELLPKGVEQQAEGEIPCTLFAPRLPPAGQGSVKEAAASKPEKQKLEAPRARTSES